MDDSNQDNIWTVYVHINKKNFKCYVGVTSKSPEKRWLNGIGYKNQLFYNAIKKYGWDGFYHEIVASGITKDEAENFEKILIDKLDSLINKNGYNVAVGGIGGYRYDEMVPVYQFDIYGNFIKEYNSIANIEREFNIPSSNIIACCKNKYIYAGGYVWQYKRDVPDLLKFKENFDDSLYDQYKPVYQFDMNQNFIAEYKCASEAAKTNDEFFSVSILDACRGKYNYSCGYIWRFKNDVPNVDEFKNEHINFSRKQIKTEHVMQFNLDGSFIKEFNSASEAAKQYNCDSHTITYACSGRTKTGVGYLWMWSRNYNGVAPSYTPPKKRSKPVLKFDKNNNFIKKYESPQDAGRENKINPADIRATCRGEQKTCGGYIWKYE